MDAPLAAKLIFIARLVWARAKLISRASVIATLFVRDESDYVPPEEINRRARCDRDRLISFAEVPSSE